MSKQRPVKQQKNKEMPVSQVPAPAARLLSLHAHVADRMAKQASRLAAQRKQLIEIASNNATVAATIFEVVVGMVGCKTLTEMRKFWQGRGKEGLKVAAVRLEVGGAARLAALPWAAAVLEQAPKIHLGPIEVERDRALFGTKVDGLKSRCLLPLFDQHAELVGILALGSTEAGRFHAGQATDLAEFLGRVLGVQLGHWQRPAKPARQRATGRRA